MFSDSTYRRFLVYFIPLALQSMAQCLTYPLVAMVASRGEGGPLNLAGMAQALAVISVLLTLSSGMVTAGMVFGKTRDGFARCVRINNLSILAVSVLYLLLMAPPVAHVLFGRLMGLPPPIEKPAGLAFLVGLPMTILFTLRNPYQIVLLNNNATAWAFGATAGRIVLTLGLAPLFCAAHWVGPVWAMVCLSAPVALEVLLARMFARPYFNRILPTSERPPDYLEVLVFTCMLSVGSLFLSLSGFMVGAFIARAAEPERTLPVYYLVLGVVNLAVVGAMRLQALVLAWYGQSERINRQLRNFSLGVGGAAGLLSLVFLLPGLIDWYYVSLQNLAPADLPLVRQTAWALVLFPFAVALRAYSEGKAAWFKKPVTVLSGQAVYLAAVAVVAFFALNLGLPGNLLGALTLLLANLAAAGMVLFSLRWEQRGDIPAVPAEVVE
jgi:hypothetical protein